MPVPWQAIHAQAPGEYVLNIDRKKLQAAPTLPREGAGNLDRPEFMSQIHEFYGIQPEGVGGTGSDAELQKGQREEKGARPGELKDQ